MKTNNILVPLDFSSESRNALQVAIQIAQRTDATISLLHVLEIPSASYSMVGDVYAGSVALDNVYTSHIQESAESQLTSVVQWIEKQGVEVNSNIVHGSVFREIEQRARQDKVDLIVMGSKGASGWQEVLIGSNAEKVIRQSKIPVLIIKKPLDLDDIRNILLAVGDDTDRSVDAAKAMQLLTGATCHLLKVYRRTTLDKTLEQTEKDLQEFAEKTGFRDYTTNVVFAQWVEEGILDFVTNHSIDMIIIGTHGYKGINHFLLGSHAEDIANHSELPVLSINIKD